MVTEQPFVSAIVPTYNDEERLWSCLASLEQQNYAAGHFEVIVIDNGSTKPLTDLASKFPHVRVVRESRPGSYAARNAGIRASRGTVLAFTDSDCVPSADWLSCAVVRLRSLGERGIVAGRIEREPGGEPFRLAELYDREFFMRQELYARAGFGVTANLIAHGSLFDEVGPFDPSLLSGGDMEWGQRATRRGAHLRYCPEVVVRHPLLGNVSAVLTKSRRVVGGHVQRRRAGAYALREQLRDVVTEVYNIQKKQIAFRAGNPRASPWLDLQMSGLITLLQMARAAERMRLLLGGEPRRS